MAAKAKTKENKTKETPPDAPSTWEFSSDDLSDIYGLNSPKDGRPGAYRRGPPHYIFTSHHALRDRPVECYSPLNTAGLVAVHRIKSRAVVLESGCFSGVEVTADTIYRAE